MDIREELFGRLAEFEMETKEHENFSLGYALGDRYTLEQLLDFLLSKETLELLKPLYGVDEDKAAKIAYGIDKEEVGDDLLSLDTPEAKKYYFGLAKALFDGDIVGVRKD